MSSNEISDADSRKTRRITRQRTTHRRGLRTGIIGSLVAGLILGSGGITAVADVGGGGVGGGPNAGGGLASQYWLFTGDSFDANMNPYQGWGQASIDYFASAMEQNGGWSVSLGSGRSGINAACNEAITQAISRSNGASNRARVIQVGTAVGQQNGGWWMGWGGSKTAMTDWYNQQTSSGSWQAQVPHYDQSLRNAVYNAFISAIPDAPRVVCVALNETEVPNYQLSISTDKQGAFSVAGSQAAVSDRIHASTSSSLRENVTAQVTLHWGGVEGNPRQVSKNVSIANSGSTNSPGFSPSDFGWTSWPAGKFWFDVSVAQQGRMREAVNHWGENDGRENWTASKTPPRKVLTSGSARHPLAADEALAAGQSYNAEITARTNGYASSMTITDTIATSKVWIGSDSADAAAGVYMLDPNGNRTDARINIAREAERVVVSGTVTNIPGHFQAQEYTLVVPTFVQPTGSDYTIADQSRVCYTAAGNDCLEGNGAATRKVTADPDKAWVLDEAGALVPAGAVDGKTFAPGSAIGAVINGSIPAKLAENFTRYELVDDWTAAAKYVDFSDATLARVYLDGRDVTAQFDITVEGTKTIATATEAFLATTARGQVAREVKLYVGGALRADYTTAGKEQLTNAGSERWNNEEINTNVPAIFTVTPKPNKAWVLDEDGALTTSDKEWTDAEGADEKVFLQNDFVAAVVNGSIPAGLGSPLVHYSITDDWTEAAEYVDFSDVSGAKLFYDGVDVTAGFSVNVTGTRTTATAGEAFLKATAGLAKDGQVKLVITGKFRDDYDTHGEVITLTNSGEETWNNRTEKSNSPAVYAWTPDPNKQVLGSSEESGDKAHDDINGTSVWPGQKLEYSVGIDLRIPAGTARGVKSLAVEDVYDPYFIVDKESVEFWDSRNPLNPRPVPRSAYELTFDDAGHTFRATFTEQWLAQNLAEEGPNSRWLSQGWLTMRVTGTVSKAIPAGATVVNQAFQIINDARTASDVPTVSIPVVEPDKQSLSTDQIDIDGKPVLQGDKIIYRLLLDAGPARSELAYNVHKLGMVDDYDHDYLEVDAADITVTEKETGRDVTGSFNVQVKDGVAYVFAKTVDTPGVYGGIIPGEPQPGDLAAYDAAPIRPLLDPLIDQELLGKHYWVTIPATVTAAKDGHTIENQARQNLQNVHTATRIVSNPVGDIDPSKDVVVSEETAGESIAGTEVRMNTAFTYRLDSSEIPADRAYRASQWSISDTFDRVHDQYTGIWAIHANTDLYDGDELLAAKGALLQNSSGEQAQPWGDLFEVTFDQDSYTLRVEATPKYLELVDGRGDLTHAFSIYAKVLRIAPGEGIENKATESYNDFERETNIVDTFTIEYPGVAVQKFATDKGPIDGANGDLAAARVLTDAELALTEPEAEGAEQLQKGVEVSVIFGNAGDVPLKDVTLVDYTHEGLHGQLQNLMCGVPADPTAPGLIENDTVTTPDENGMVWVLPSTINELAVAEEVHCRGTLRDMAPGMTHGDTVVVTGKSIFTDALVKAEDSWFAKATSTPQIELVEYTLDEGREVGDRNDPGQALEVTDGQASNGVKVGFDITNVGNEPLSTLAFDNATQESTSGAVENVKWLQPVETDEPDADPVAAAADAGAEGTEETAEETETVEPSGTEVEYGGVKYLEREVTELRELAVGERVLLVGTLVGIEPGALHTDLSWVTAAGAYSGLPVDDEDPWNARYPAAPPMGVVAGEVIAASDSRKTLLLSAGMLMVAAAVVTLIIRRRRGARTSA